MNAPSTALRSISGPFVARCIGAAASAIYGILLADVLAPTAMGAFAVAISAAVIAATVSKCGLDAYLMRRTALRPQVAGRLALRCAAAAGVVGMAFALASAWIGAEVRPSEAWTFGAFQVAVPFLAMSFVLAGLLKAGNLPAAAVLLETGGWQTGLCACALLMQYAGSESLTVVALFFAGGSTLAFAAAIAATRHVLSKPGEQGPQPTERKAPMRAVAPLAGISACQVVMRWSDVLWLGWWLDAPTVAAYVVCTRLAGGVGFIDHAINAVTAPRFARRHTSGGQRALQLDFRHAVAVSAACAVAGAVAVAALGPFVLDWLGPPYGDSVGVLMAAAVLMALHVSLAPIAHLAAMTERPAAHLKGTAIMLVLQQAIFAFLVPRYGLPAALLGFALPQALSNLLALALLRRKES